MDSRLDQNQTEFGVLVFTAPLQMPADGHRLLDQVVKVLGQVRDVTHGLHDTKDLAPRDEPHLSNTMGISKNHADLWGSEAFFAQFEDVVLDFLWCEFQPGGDCPAVGKCALGNTLTANKNNKFKLVNLNG